MADLIKELVNGVVESVLKEILKKTTGSNTTKRTKRQTRSATTGRFKKAAAPPKTAKKQVSKRRTAAVRTKQRSR
ncbi:hypothetical protein [Rhizobium sp. BE258]|jgi:hypothetical protein|uniref:hypothetical protein n=1 Tax=Rhizobium sp. BE258 TaxID=2817722 RepID=UPI002855F59D|nr:hypothetical protein [Rhizobium sp. BE258]MDR7147299.1 hypothetical protein [Rhizobium sp. BE258]